MTMKHEPAARRLSGFLAIAVALAVCAPVLVAASASQPAQPPAGYERVTGSQEALPAAPFLVAAYAVIWVVLIVYLWSIWRRVRSVQRELADLKRRLDEKPGA
jgi:CcmD family protein